MATDTQQRRGPGRPRGTTGTKHRQGSGIVDSRKVYSGKVFCRVMGCDWHTFMSMRERGLKVRKDGSRVMVRGGDYYEYLGTLPGDERDAAAQSSDSPDGSTGTSPAHAEAGGTPAATDGPVSNE